MNNRGFTLVELIAVVIIMGILSLYAIPSVMNVMSENSKNTCKFYERSMIEAAKLYVQREERDLLEGNKFPITLNFNSLKDVGLEEYKDNKTKVNNNDIKVKVCYSSDTKTYTYSSYIKCIKNNGSLLYESEDFGCY